MGLRNVHGVQLDPPAWVPASRLLRPTGPSATLTNLLSARDSDSCLSFSRGARAAGYVVRSAGCLLQCQRATRPLPPGRGRIIGVDISQKPHELT